jgi:hypothetical protein
VVLCGDHVVGVVLHVKGSSSGCGLACGMIVLWVWSCMHVEGSSSGCGLACERI